MWKLRQNLNAYETVYVPLAEVLDTRLLTGDRPLSRAPALGARIELIEAPSPREE